MATLQLARITIKVGTTNGRPYCVLPSGVRVALRPAQLRTLLREAALIRAWESAG